MAKGHRSQIKRERNEANHDNRPKAHARFIRIAPRKVKIVIDLIRGKKVGEALAILTYTNKAASPIVAKLLKSAVANAENNQGLSAGDLYVEQIFANQGPTLKRVRPRAQGRAYRINKKTSHISVFLNTK